MNLLATFCLVTLLVGRMGDASWYLNTESEGDISYNIHEEKRAQNGTVNNCDNNSSLSNVPACSSPWTYCDNGTCKCADAEEILCIASGQSLIQFGCCVTFDKAQALTHFGECVFRNAVVGNRDSEIILQYYSLPSNVSELDDVMCGPFNRTGMLCGKCKDGYYPLVNSLDVNCVQCPNGWSNLWKL